MNWLHQSLNQMSKTIFSRMFVSAASHNLSNILALARVTPSKSLLDLGCDDGQWTRRVAAECQANLIQGVEILPESAALATKNGIQVTLQNLDNPLPFTNDSFDLVHSNQVIEHVSDVDNFTSEAFRVIKPGGIFILSTENGSSWHNIFAAILGWQTFSLTSLSRLRSGIGNPLAIHQGQAAFTGKWTHKVIFNYRGLIDFLKEHGFSRIEVLGAGYYPFSTSFAKLDPRHAHFITAKAYKPIPVESEPKIRVKDGKVATPVPG